jgi:succinoglycan biosynthesis transport protein ExoP
LIGTAVGVAYIVLAPTLYKSAARILIDKSVSRYLQANKIAEELAFDDMETGSQIYVLTSESIVVPVVRSMNLASDPEFADEPKPRGWGIGKLLTNVKHSIGWGTETAVDADTVRERTAVETFLKQLTVNREDVANVINVTFASKDSEKAAKIANALADTYLATALKAKFDSNKMASQLLQERLVNLRHQVNDADRALQDYRIANNVTGAGTGFLYSAQMSSLNSRMIAARIAMVESKARAEYGQQSPGDGKLRVPVPDNDVITKLRAQYLDLSVMATEMEGRVGPEHLAVVKLRKRMDRLRGAMEDEKGRISGNFPSEHELAKARYDELAVAFGELTGEAKTSSQAQAATRELESTAETLRSLYNASLQKFNEINKVQPQSIPVQDARIITRAAPPLYKDSKKPLAALGGSIVLGLLLGAGAALARELAGGVFQTPGQVKSATDIYCGIMPTVETRRRRIAALLSGTKPSVLEEHVLDAPYSRFAETVRNIKAFADGARRANGDKVICVVSSVANEGKTTILTNLAALMASSSTARVLVIDCDLHRRRLTAKLAPDAREGLIEALDDPSRLASLVSKRERSGLNVLPCVLSARIPNAAELLGSSEMEKLLDAARAAYDFVLIEVPPIMSVVDIKMVERFVDRFVFVVEWGKTSRRVVQEALSEAEFMRDRMMCIVLNKADPAALRSMEAYKGPRFGDYYVA